MSNTLSALPNQERAVWVRADELFPRAISKLKPAETVLDIGCGIRPQNYIIPRVHICCEPFEQYINILKGNVKNDTSRKYSFVNADWEKALEIFPEKSVDTVFLVDIIEHLPKEKSLKLLKDTERIARSQIAVFTTLGFIPQHHPDGKDAWGLDGGAWQEHKSGWEPEDFGAGWDILVAPDFHKCDNMGVQYEVPHGAIWAIKTLIEPILFSVLIPTYNQANYLGAALDSLLAQTYSNWEAIIVNDGSTDDTARILQKYADSDGRFHVFHKSNGGVASALNEGLRHINGGWICWLSSDDLFEPDKLAVHLEAIHRHPGIRFFYSHFYYLDDSTGAKSEPDLWNPIPDRFFQVSRFFLGPYIHGNSIAIHRDVFDAVGFFNETMRNGQDYDMWLRISAKFPSRFIEDRTCVTRWHPGQTTNEFPEAGFFDSARAAIEFVNQTHFSGLFPLLNLEDTNQALAAVKETIAISTTPASLIHSCGPSTALLDRLVEWLGNIDISQRNIIQATIGSFVQMLEGNNHLAPIIREALIRLKHPEGYVYPGHNVVLETTHYAQELELQGDTTKAEALRRYIKRIINNGGMPRSNLANWQQLQEDGYFERHQCYGKAHAGLELFGEDVATIERYKPLAPYMKVVVIGCGYGRESALIAPHVRHVYGIDVSRTILDKAEKFVASKGVTNFTSVLAEQWKDSIPEGIDVVYSMVVFQHLTRDLVRDYVNGLAAKLLPRGVFVCQFADLVYGTADAAQKTYEPSVRWSREEISQLVKNAGLTLFRVDTQEIPGEGYWHWVFFGKTPICADNSGALRDYPIGESGRHASDLNFAEKLHHHALNLDPQNEAAPHNLGLSFPAEQMDTPLTVESYRKILIACDYFWPSIGGTELFVEDIASRLIKDGYRVDVATSWMAQRTGTHHKGVRIFQFRCAGNLNEGGPRGEIDDYRNLIVSGGYNAVIVLGHPDLWVGLGIVGLPVSHPRIILLPSINAENILNWSNSGLFGQAAAILTSADSVVSVTESGYDAKFMDAIGLKHHFIPHAVEQDASPANFRYLQNISEDVPLLVMVANFWPVKNHLALLGVLANMPGHWRLLLIGHPIPSQQDYFFQVKELAEKDQRVGIIAGLPREQAASAIRDADVLLIPSKGESAGPLVLLQAMSFGTPWIATPECNAVNDEAGGVVAPLSDFPAIIQRMLLFPDIRKRLGTVARKHWQMCFTWARVWNSFRSIIEDRGEVLDLSMPREIRLENARLVDSLFLGQISAKSECPLPHKDVQFAESALAHKYCIGKGLEIGGSAHNPFGLNTVNVDLSGSMETYFKDEERTNCGRTMAVDIVAGGDNIPLPDASQDFVVSSHVLEHFPNPVKALLEWDRLVRPGGVLFMIIPHKDRTFEVGLERTTLEHVVDDYLMDTPADGQFPALHYHCWMTDDVVTIIEWMQAQLGVQWRIEEVQDVDDKVGNGFTIVIRKLSNRSEDISTDYVRNALPYVSVVVPTYNRSAILGDFLAALERQSYPHDRFEVIICDDGSGDETAGLIKSFRPMFSLSYIYQQNSGPATARNKALAKARGDIVLIMNDDAIAASNLIWRHVKAHSQLKGQKVAVLGLFDFAEENITTPLMHLMQHSDLLFQYVHMKPQEVHKFGCFWTCNISIERKAFDEAGGFDEDFKEAAGEDTELGYRLSRLGYSVLYDPSCKAVHRHTIGFYNFCNRQLSVGRNNILVALKHPEITRLVIGLPSLETAEQDVLAWYHQHVNAAVMAMSFIHRLNDSCTGDREQIQARAAQIFGCVNLVNQFWLYQGFLEGIGKYLPRQSTLFDKLTITFITPGTDISGGVKVIIEYCNRLAALGHKVFLFSMNKGYPNWITLHPAITFTVLDWSDAKKENVQELPDADAIIATQWFTAYFVAGVPLRKGVKYYLVQDYESQTITTPENADPTYMLPLKKIVVSSWLGKLLQNKFGQQSRYIRNAIDTSVLYPDPEIRLLYSAEEIRIGMLWHMEPRKDSRNGLEAFELIRQNHPSARLVLFGTAEPPDIKYDEFHHKIYGPEVRNYYCSLDFFVSTSWQEGFGLPGLEALACGVPLVTTNSGGVGDYAFHEQTSLVVPVKNPKEIADAIDRLIRDRGLAQRLAMKGLAKAQEFSWDKAVSHMESFLLETNNHVQGAVKERPLSKPADVSNKQIRVFVSSLDLPEHACGYYRLFSPLKSLSESLSFEWGISFRGKDVQLRPEILNAADIIVIQRFFPCKESQTFIDYLFTLNKPIIYEVDDLLTNMPGSNPNNSVGSSNVAYIRDLMRRCAAVSVSTGELKRHFENYNPNIFVLPNLLNDTLWHMPSPKHTERPLVISYTGTITHAVDIALLEEVLERISAAYPGEVSFTFMGCTTARLSRLPGFTFIPFETTYEAYARKLQQVPIDIALVPLEDNLFNRCKSNIKWLEYSACGVPGIYADLPPYNGSVKHGETGLLVGSDPEQWFQAICLLIEQPEYRRKLAENARQEVLENYSLSSKAALWQQTYQTILDNYQNKKQIRFSILILTWNRAGMLDACLGALFSALKDRDVCEIIVGDNASTDDTARIVKKYPVDRYVAFDTNKSVDRYRELFEYATGEYLICLDDDVIELPKGFEQEFERYFKEFSDYGLLGLNVVQNALTNGAKPAAQYYCEDRRGPLVVEEGFVIGCCMCISRKSFNQLGGFGDGALTMRMGDDAVLYHKVKGAGLRAGILQAVSCLHACGPQYAKKFNCLEREIEKYRANDMVEMTATYEALQQACEKGLQVSIIIPAFNQLQFTRQCLQALFSTLPADIASEIIVVDNASSDGTSDYLSSLSDQVRVITNATNLGFAKACNQGAWAAQGEYLLFLNNDTVPQSGWLEPLLKAVQSGEADICGARLLYPDGRCQHAGIAFDERGLGYHIFGGFAGDAPEVQQRREMQAVTGACVMISKQLFSELGGFDEGFLNGFEDVDLCLRAGELGKKILYQPESVVIHYAEQTPGRKDHDLPNMQRFFRRWSGKLRQDDQHLYRQFGLTCSKDQEGRFRITREPDSAPQVSIIIPLFNQAPLTEACLSALQRFTPQGRYELILVDNGSTDGTPALLERWRHAATIIRNHENHGFARACNQGARAARGEYLLFLNNDTEVTDGWLEALLRVVKQDASVAAVGSKLLYPDGTLQHAGVLLVDDQQQGDPLVGRHLYQRMPGNHPPANVMRTLQALTAACLLVRRQDFKAVSGFDEGYWNGYEDLDLCLKLAAAGKRLVYQPLSVVTHHESQSGPERFRQAAANIQRLHQHWLGKVQVDAIIQADGTIQHGPGMLNGTTAIYQPPVAQAVAQQEAQLDTTARQRRYQLVPLVAGSASSLVQRLSSSRRTRDVLQRYTVDD